MGERRKGVRGQGKGRMEIRGSESGRDWNNRTQRGRGEGEPVRMNECECVVARKREGRLGHVSTRVTLLVKGEEGGRC